MTGSPNQLAIDVLVVARTLGCSDSMFVTDRRLKHAREYLGLTPAQARQLADDEIEHELFRPRH